MIRFESIEKEGSCERFTFHVPFCIRTSLLLLTFGIENRFFFGPVKKIQSQVFHKLSCDLTPNGTPEQRTQSRMTSGARGSQGHDSRSATDPSPQGLGQPHSTRQQLHTGHTSKINLTRAQRTSRFDLEQRKIEAELAVMEDKVAESEARAKRESQESQVKIVALQLRSATAISTQTQGPEDSIGAIPPVALLVANKYPALPKTEIAKIFSNQVPTSKIV